MAVFRAAVRSLCGPYFHFGKTWNRWSKFKSGNRIRTVVVVVMAGEWYFLPMLKTEFFRLEEKAGFFSSCPALPPALLALLLPCITAGRRLKVVPVDKLSVVMTLILAFVFLHEDFTAKSLIGCILIGAGTLVMVL